MRGVLTLLLIGAALSLSGCGRGEAQSTAMALTGGDPDRGKVAIKRYGCDTCHTIPGIRGANAVVGPSLERLGVRAYIRHLPNTPDNLILWIRDPKQVHEQTPMPDTGVSEQDGRDIAAYLYTLR
jgi:cytochrome c